MIAEILHKIAAMENESENDRPYYPRPSLAGPERCIRQMVYWGLKFPRQPFPGRTLHVFSDGVWHEELTADWIRKSAFQLHSEQMKVVVAHNGMVLTGHTDGILTDPLGVDRAYEHKGINHFSFQRYWNGALPLDNLTQLSLYMKGLQDEANPEIVEGILLIKNKNTSQYMEYLVAYDNPSDTLLFKQRTNSLGETIDMDGGIENICKDAFDKFAKVEEYIRNKTLPKRPYDMTDWHCEYCPYGGLCWENYEQEFDELTTDHDLPAEFADKVRYYQELGGHMGDMKKERDQLSKEIKKAMHDAEAKEGRAGEYVCKLSLQKRSGWDESKIPPNIIEIAKTVSMSERLTISNTKKGG